MNKKLINLYIFIASTILFVLVVNHTHISTALLSMLPQSKQTDILKTFEQQSSHKTLMVSVKGFDQQSLSLIQRIQTQLTSLSDVHAKKLNINQELLQHQQEYFFLTQDIDIEKIKNLDVNKELKKLYYNLFNSFIPLKIDKNDPLELYKKRPKQPSIKIKNGHLVLDKYGYISYFDIHATTMESYKKVYEQIHNIQALKNDARVTFFSPMLYYVENSEAIKTDINHIIMIATIVLVLLYIILLKNITLLINTLLTLGTSAMISTVVLTYLFDEISIFVLVFGIAISTIAIDYMFHHYFHEHYKKYLKLNKDVLFGFLTTLSAFIIFSFSSFTLIQQISIFAIISLSISYLHFAFIYPKIFVFDLQVTAFRPIFSNYQMNPKLILSFSLITILLSISWLSFDLNIKNLDYHNKTLHQKENFFKTHLSVDTYTNVYIEAPTIGQLIKRTRSIDPNISLGTLAINTTNQQLSLIKNQLLKQATEIGFREDYFKDAYKTDVAPPSYTLKQIQKYGIPIHKYKTAYITHARIQTSVYHEHKHHNYIGSLHPKTLFEHSIKETLDELIVLGSLALFSIFFLLLLITKKHFLRASLYILFPISIVLGYGYFMSLNVLHVFMLFVILSIGIDYAIYSVNQKVIATKQAISYSLLSTFAGFGVFIFSDIPALYSMGVIASIAIVSISILLLLLKGNYRES